jgi:hypothetical protein
VVIGNYYISHTLLLLGGYSICLFLATVKG